MISLLVDYLAAFYRTGNFVQLEAIARSMLVAVPNDLVALQFLGLALYQTGRVDDAHRTFKRVAATPNQQEKPDGHSVCELAHVTIFRAATQAHSGLADGWHRIAVALNGFGFHKAATRAFAAASAVRGSGLTSAVSPLPI